MWFEKETLNFEIIIDWFPLIKLYNVDNVLIHFKWF